jgi:hypothetical protein
VHPVVLWTAGGPPLVDLHSSIFYLFNKKSPQSFVQFRELLFLHKNNTMAVLERAGLLPEGGEWEIFRNSSISEEFDEDRSEEIETQGKLSYHRIRVHAIRIHKSEEHTIIHSYTHEANELMK